MKIEKISQGRIKVTLTYEEMTQWAVDLENLTYNSPQVQDLFWAVMKRAEDELGFVIDSSQVMVEAIPAKPEGFVLFVSKVEEEQTELAKYVRSRLKRTDIKVKRRQKCTPLPCIYEFELFDNMTAALSQIQPFFEGSSMLYKYGDKYYILMFSTNNLNSLIDNNMCEYGSKIENPTIFEGRLTEHGRVLIGQNAVDVLCSYFS